MQVGKAAVDEAGVKVEMTSADRAMAAIIKAEMRAVLQNFFRITRTSTRASGVDRRWHCRVFGAGFLPRAKMKTPSVIKS